MWKSSGKIPEPPAKETRKLQQEVNRENNGKNKERIPDPPVRTENFGKKGKRRSGEGTHDKKVIAAGERVEYGGGRRYDAQIQNRIPEMPDGRVNPPGKEKRKRIGREHRVPEKAVEAHEIPERVGGPVRKNQRAEGPRHEKNQTDLSESLPEAAETFREKSMKKIDEDCEAAQVERQIGGAHTADGNKEQVPQKVSEKEQERCDFQDAVLPPAAAAKEQEAVKDDPGRADSECRKMLRRKQAEPDPGGKIMNFFPEILHISPLCFLYYNVRRKGFSLPPFVRYYYRSDCGSAFVHSVFFQNPYAGSRLPHAPKPLHSKMSDDIFFCLECRKAALCIQRKFAFAKFSLVSRILPQRGVKMRVSE